MIQVIHCTECGKEGALPFILEYDMHEKPCATCHHIEENMWRYWFCSWACITAWMQKNARAFPCRDCRETGYRFGFKQNGTCPTCHGTKRVVLK